MNNKKLPSYHNLFMISENRFSEDFLEVKTIISINIIQITNLQEFP